MKKLILVTAIAFLSVGAAFAQNWGNPWGVSEIVTVNGTLQLRDGAIAVVSGSNAYFAPTLTQYVGFIDGLREGAQISMEGVVSGNYIQPTKVTIGGRTYDFSATAAPRGMNNISGWGCRGAGLGRNSGTGWGRQIGSWGCW